MLDIIGNLIYCHGVIVVLQFSMLAYWHVIITLTLTYVNIYKISIYHVNVITPCNYEDHFLWLVFISRR